MIGTKLNDDPLTWGGDYKDEIKAYIPYTYSTSTLYERDGTGSTSAVVNALNSGENIVNHMGHGSPDYFGYLSRTDVDGLTNTEYFLVYSQGCYTTAFDNRWWDGTYDSDDCIAEHMIYNSTGAVAFIGNSRYGWYAPGSTNGSSQLFDKEFFDALFNENIVKLGNALQDSKEDLYGVGWRWCYFTLNLLGDPTLDITTQPDYAIGVSCTNNPQTSLPDNTLTYDVKVTNMGKQNDTIDLSLTVPTGWTGNLSDSQVYLTSGDSTTVTATITVPPGTASDDYTSNFVATSQGDPSVSNTLDLVTMVTSGNIVYDSCTIDDDKIHNSWGNDDGIVNPDELIELPVTLRNSGTEDIYDVEAYLSTTDPYVIFDCIAFTDDYEYFGDIPAGSTATCVDYEFLISAQCPDGHTIEFMLDIYDSHGHNWQDTFEITVYGTDQIGPHVWLAGTSGYVRPGNNAFIITKVEDSSGIQSVTAEIESPDENVIATIDLYDDGKHGDRDALDGHYANYWKTDYTPRDYLVDIIATDASISHNQTTANNYTSFTTKPFEKTADILVVDDTGWYEQYNTFYTYYTNALDANGYNYDVWHNYYGIYGVIDSETLMKYKDGIVIWATPYWGSWWYYDHEYIEDILTQYLDAGGSLFISGQDIGWMIGGSTFYTDYLHADYVQDNIGLYGLFGVTGDPISDGMYLNISGGDGANNQMYPSEIDPISPATTIFEYDANATMGAPTIQYEIPNEKEKLLSKEPTGIISSGSGGIKVADEGYKVVYLSFGFEAIDNATDRNTLMDRVVKWLQYKVDVETDAQVIEPEDTLTIFATPEYNGTPVTGASVTAEIYDPDNVLYTTLTMYDNGTHGDVTSGDGTYTNTLTPAFTDTKGTWRIEVTSNHSTYGDASGKSYFDLYDLSYGNLAVTVKNTEGKPAPMALVEAYDKTEEHYIEEEVLTDEAGVAMLNLGVPPIYDIAAVSEWDYRYEGYEDSFFIIDRDVSVEDSYITYITLDASTGTPIDIQTNNINGEPISSNVALMDCDTDLDGNVAETNDYGSATIYVTPDNYNVIMRAYSEKEYFLYKENVDTTTTTYIEFSPTPSTTSTLNINFDKTKPNENGFCWLNPNINYRWWWSSDEEQIVTPGEWNITPSGRFISMDNGYWGDYYEWMSSTIDLTTPGSSYTYNFGGDLTMHVDSSGTYSPGDTAEIDWNLKDEYGFVIDRIYEGTEPLQQEMCTTEKEMEKMSEEKPLAYEWKSPRLTILDPYDNVVVSGDIDWYEDRPYYWYIPEYMTEGTYTAKVEVDTGPLQGEVSEQDTLNVGEVAYSAYVGLASNSSGQYGVHPGIPLNSDNTVISVPNMIYGSGWRSFAIVTNVGNTTASGTIHYYNSDGDGSEITSEAFTLEPHAWEVVKWNNIVTNYGIDRGSVVIE